MIVRGQGQVASCYSNASDKGRSVGSGQRWSTQVAEADPGPVMPNLDTLLLKFILLLFLLFVSSLYCVKVYLVANKYAHVLP